MRKIIAAVLVGIFCSGFFAFSYADFTNKTVSYTGVFPSGNFYFQVTGSGTIYYFSASGDANKSMISIVLTAYALGHSLDCIESNGVVTGVAVHR